MSDPPVATQRAERRAAASILALNFATGVVEAVALAHLGGIFVAYVTGTIILAGVHMGTGWLEALLPYGVAFGSFLAGGLAGGAMVRTPGSVRMVYVRTLAIEVVVLTLAAISLAPTFTTDLGRVISLSLLAFAMAVQFSATRFLDVPNLKFAAATGLVHGLAHEISARRRVPRNLVRRLLALATLVLGAAAGAAIASWSVALAIVAATVVVAGAALMGLLLVPSER